MPSQSIAFITTCIVLFTLSACRDAPTQQATEPRTPTTRLLATSGDANILWSVRSTSAGTLTARKVQTPWAGFNTALHLSGNTLYVCLQPGDASLHSGLVRCDLNDLIFNESSAAYTIISSPARAKNCWTIDDHTFVLTMTGIGIINEDAVDIIHPLERTDHGYFLATTPTNRFAVQAIVGPPEIQFLRATIGDDGPTIEHIATCDTGARLIAGDADAMYVATPDGTVAKIDPETCTTTATRHTDFNNPQGPVTIWGGEPWLRHTWDIPRATDFRNMRTGESRRLDGVVLYDVAEYPRP